MAKDDVINLLLIEENATDASQIKNMLHDANDVSFMITHVATLHDLENKLSQMDFQIIVSELNLSESQGTETVNKIKHAFPELPLVIVSGVEDSDVAVQMIAQGVQDYLVKGHYSAPQLINAIRFSIQRQQKLVELNHSYQSHEKNQSEAYDLLTGLPSQQTFFSYLQDTVEQAKQQQQLFAMLFVTINEIAKVNEKLGHQAGDTLIKSVALKLSDFISENQYVARYGHNEFVILIAELAFRKEVSQLADSLQKYLAQPILLDSQEYMTATSIGIVIYPFDADDADRLIEKARSAMTVAREQGLNRIVFFSDQRERIAEEKLIWENEIQLALKSQQFFLNFQPQFDIEGEKVVGAEALIRWKHPKLGFVGPDKFIPIAEESGLISPIGRWVMETCFKQINLWQARGLKKGSVIIAINVSTQQLQHENLYILIKNLLQTYKIDPSFVEIELTERALAENTEAMINRLRQIQSLGVSVSIDDFGTGYSSLSYLGHLPINKVKIDRSFVVKNVKDPATRMVVKSIISMIHGLGLEVIGEGVETKEQLQLLKQQGCDIIQGFYFSRPLPVEEFGKLLKL